MPKGFVCPMCGMRFEVEYMVFYKYHCTHLCAFKEDQTKRVKFLILLFLHFLYYV